jgi:hypothetical protein
MHGHPDRPPPRTPWLAPGAPFPGVYLGPGRDSARTGLPDSAAGPGRTEAVDAGLYGGQVEDGYMNQGRSRPELRPDVPAEPDAFDLPALPYMRVCRRRGE